MWEILIDGESEVESATLVHAFVGFYCENEVENVIGIWKGKPHCTAERELGKICRVKNGQFRREFWGLAPKKGQQGIDVPF